MMSRGGVALTIGCALGFILGIAVWGWRLLAPEDAEGNKPKFSFSELITGSSHSGSRSSPDLPVSVNEVMPVTPPEIAEPVLLRYGEFNSVQDGRTARGEIRVFKLGTGEHMIRLEQFTVTRGPGLHLYLTNAAAPRSAEAVLRDFIDLGDLKAQGGEQNYLVPGDVDISDYRGVIVFSPLFKELYASGALIDAAQ